MKNNKRFIVYVGISLISILIGLGMIALPGKKIEYIISFVAYGILVMILIINLSSFITSLCYKGIKLTLKKFLPILIFLIINILFILFYLAMILVNYLIH